MRKARVRLEVKRLPSSARKEDHMRNLTIMQRIFRRMCNDYGINQEYRDHEFFIRESDKRRRKKMAKRHAQAANKDNYQEDNKWQNPLI